MEPRGNGMFTVSACRISNAYDQLWDVLEGKKLFRNIDPACVHEYDEQSHFAHIMTMLVILGLPKG